MAARSEHLAWATERTTAGVGGFHPGEHLLALARWLVDAMERSAQRRTLAALDHRLLADIGLTRAQALAEARKPFWRR